jgi:hypothetical protein
MSSTVVKDDFIEYVRPGDPDWDDEAPGGQERRVRRAFLVSTFIDRDYYVQTISDDDNRPNHASRESSTRPRGYQCWRVLTRPSPRPSPAHSGECSRASEEPGGAASSHGCGR